eukprot:GILK01007493.1.p1 GENE.GILK01007493.1~~GILK01007493.1.p1  ORF type:complete len:739 (+),score=170.98 GILK01007493.1:319-2217(+)
MEDQANKIRRQEEALAKAEEKSKQSDVDLQNRIVDLKEKMNLNAHMAQMEIREIKGLSQDLKFILTKNEQAVTLLQTNIDTVKRSSDTKYLELADTIENKFIKAQGLVTKLSNELKADAEHQSAQTEKRLNQLSDQAQANTLHTAKLDKEAMEMRNKQEETALIVDRLVTEQVHRSEVTKVEDEARRFNSQVNLRMDELKKNMEDEAEDVRVLIERRIHEVAKANTHAFEDTKKGYEQEIDAIQQSRTNAMQALAATQAELDRVLGIIKEMQGKIDATLDEVRAELDQKERRRRKDKSDMEIELAKMGKSVNHMEGLSQFQIRSIENLAVVVANLVEEAQVRSVLDSQDEEDKKSISLYGYKDTDVANPNQPGSNSMSPRPPSAPATSRPVSAMTNRSLNKSISESPFRPQSAAGSFPSTPRGGSNTPQSTHTTHPFDGPVKLERACLSCSGQSSIVMTAFKMACLQYIPSPVRYRNKAWRRDQLLEKRRSMLRSLWEAVVTSEPWKRKIHTTESMEDFDLIEKKPAMYSIPKNSWSSVIDVTSLVRPEDKHPNEKDVTQNLAESPPSSPHQVRVDPAHATLPIHSSTIDVAVVTPARSTLSLVSPRSTQKPNQAFSAPKFSLLKDKMGGTA